MDDEVSARRAEAEEARVLTPVAATGMRGRLQRAAAGPLAESQQAFNGTLLRLVDALSLRVDAAAKRAEAAERRVAELEERLLRLERRDGDGRAGTVAAQPRQGFGALGIDIEQHKSARLEHRLRLRQRVDDQRRADSAAPDDGHSSHGFAFNSRPRRAALGKPEMPP